MAARKRTRKTTAEMYKSRHNIGNRSAAERARQGSYRESEIALYFPDTYWPAVKVDFQSNSPSHVQDSTADETDGKKKVLQAKKDSGRDASLKKISDSTKEETYVRRDSSPCSTQKVISSNKKNMSSSKTALSSPRKDQKSADSKQQKSDNNKPCAEEESKSVERAKSGKTVVKLEKAVTSSKLQKNSAKGSKTILVEANDPKGANITRKQKTTKKESYGADSDRDSKAGSKKHQQVAKKRPGKYSDLKPRAPRIKRTACLNSGAITMLMLEGPEPASKKKKSATDDDETEEEEEEEDDSSEDDEVVIRKSPSVLHEKHGQKNSDDEETQKCKKITGSQYLSAKKIKLSKKVTGESAAKALKDAKHKMTQKDDKRKPGAKKKKTLKRKSPVDIPLWPPPKRMASLNAQVRASPYCVQFFNF